MFIPFVCISLFPLGAFSRFLPTLPYPFVSGDNSPPINTHSPPASAMTNLPVTPTVLRPQPQMPPSAAAVAAVTSHLSNGGGGDGRTHPTGPTAAISPLRIRVSSPNRINSDLTSIVQHGLPPQNRANGIIRVAQHGTTNSTGLNSGISVGPPMLHRPFSPSPQPKDVS